MSYDTEISRWTNVRSWRVGRLVPLLIAIASLSATGVAEAESRRYTLTVQDGRTATYRVQVPVAHPGQLVLTAEWPGSRQLSFRLQPPGPSRPALRRYGASPLRMETTVTDTPELIGTWELRVHALAGHGQTDAMVTLTTPEPGPPEPEPGEEPPAPVPVERPSWWRAVPRPGGLSADEARFFDAVERMRAEITRDPDAVDTCRWQGELMQFLAEERTGLTGRTDRPSVATSRMLMRIAAAIDQVDRLRTSRDPLIAGPPPDDPALERTWLQVRSRKVREVENALDHALDGVQRQDGSELAAEDWPIRLVSCVTACERHFEQIPRLGVARAANRDLAEAQWQRILVAAEAIRELARLTPGGGAARTSRDRGR